MCSSYPFLQFLCMRAAVPTIFSGSFSGRNWYRAPPPFSFPGSASFAAAIKNLPMGLGILVAAFCLMVMAVTVLTLNEREHQVRASAA